MNKRTFSILWMALTALLLSCSGGYSPTSYSISGVLTDANGATLYLYELGIKNAEVLDSAVISEQGSFEFVGEASQPRLLIVGTGQENYLNLLVDAGERIKLTGSLSSLAQTVVVQGSKGTALLDSLQDRLELTHKAIMELGDAFRQQVTIPKADSIATQLSLEAQYDSLIKLQRDFSISFVKNNSSSMAVLGVFSQQMVPLAFLQGKERRPRPIPVLDPRSDDKQYYEMVRDSLLARYPEHGHVKAFATFVNGMGGAAPEVKGIVDLGGEAPEIVGTSQYGGKVALSSLRGKYVLLDFWASWCRPCRYENPNLVASYNKYKDKGFTIYQVSLDQEANAWKEAIKKDKLDWVHVSDLKGWQSEHAQAYSISSIPTSYLLDKEGKVVAMNLRGTALDEKLAEIFGQ